MSHHTVRIIIGVLVALALIAGLVWLLGLWPDNDVPTITPDAALCPEATPEYFDVNPVTSPTGELSQTVSAELGNGEVITITTESGVFVAPVTTYPTKITIDLLPDTRHALTVEGRVRQVQQGDCTYGGYVLSTTRDRDGQPLVIEQREP